MAVINTWQQKHEVFHQPTRLKMVPRLSGSILVKLPFFAGGPSELLAPASLAGRLVDIFTFCLTVKMFLNKINMRWLKMADKRKHCHHLFHGQKIINRFMLQSQIKLTSYDFSDLHITGEFDNRPGTKRFWRIFFCMVTYRTGAGRRLYITRGPKGP